VIPEFVEFQIEGAFPGASVTLYLARTPVTNAGYFAYANDVGVEPPAYWTAPRPPEVLLDHPVVNLTQVQVRTYCSWLSEQIDRSVRLPSPAEWEFAARGPSGLLFPWGPIFEPGRCNSVEAGFGTTTPVDLFLLGAGPFGAVDQCGNVWEWCDAVDNDGWTVIKGGSYLDTEWGVRPQRHLHADPKRRTSNVGFRPVVE
jgi:formylglycine-generating enzyme required for sulfatase activity